MTEAPIEQLQAVDTSLTRSFFGCVAAVVLSLCWRPPGGEVRRVAQRLATE